MSKRQVYHSNFWEEEAEADNPFATKSAYCHGYNVYDEVLQKASWFEYLYVMFKGEKPTEEQAILFEKLAIALANPGPREASVRGHEWRGCRLDTCRFTDGCIGRGSRAVWRCARSGCMCELLANIWV